MTRSRSFSTIQLSPEGVTRTAAQHAAAAVLGIPLERVRVNTLYLGGGFGRRFGFEEFALRRGDFAIAAAAVFYDPDAGGRASNAHVGVIGVGDRPARLAAVEAVLDGAPVDADMIAKAAAATSAAVDPQDDIHASAAYRRSLVGTMVERALFAATA